MVKGGFKELEKVVVNTGIGRLSSQPSFSDKIFPSLTQDFSLIVGQKPMNRPAKKSISGFKLREGSIVGLKATIRGKRMERFLEKVIKVALPRVRDFRGLSYKSIDSRGNLSFGIKDHLVFPEVSPESSKANFGVEITAVPKHPKDKAEAIKLYRDLGIPFAKEEMKSKK